MAKDTIIRLQPSDIISESMNKINYNFDLLTSQSEVDDYKYTALFKQLNDRLDEIQRNSDSRDADLANGITTLNDKMDGMSSSSLDIQDAIDSAVAAANQRLRDFIVSTVGQQVERAIGDYATTSSVSMDDVNAAIQAALAGLPDPSTGGDFDPNTFDWSSLDWDSFDLDYVRSAAFEEFVADSANKHAEASTIVANSVFVETSDHFLIYSDEHPIVEKRRTKSPYKNTWGGFKAFYLSDEVTEAQRDEINPKTEDYPDRKPWEEAIFDSHFINGLIGLMELTFMTVAKEMTLIRQEVNESEAKIDIIAQVKRALGADMTDDDARDITAAIFVEANSQTGSQITLNADRLNLTANHKLSMTTGTFEITSDNFIVTPEGKVTAYSMNAHDMNAYNLTAYGITANNITLSSNGGKTLIDQFGILHATGAEIEGKVKADEFEATAERNISTDDGYTGTVSRSTNINADSFKIQTVGSLTKGSNSIDLSQNAIYIEIIDKMANPNYGDSSKPLNDKEYLYGVPTLCMLYEGEPYRLSPGSWISANQSTVIDTSNIRWDDRYGIYNYSFNVPDSTNVNLGTYYYTNKYKAPAYSAETVCDSKPTLAGMIGIAGDYYVFKPNQMSKFLTTSGSDAIMQVHVYDLGPNDDGYDYNRVNYNLVKNAGLTSYSVSSPFNLDELNENAAYALKSRIPSGYYGYVPETRTAITDDICNTKYKGYILNNITTSKLYTFQKSYTTIPTDYGVSKMYEFMKFAAGAKYTSGNWEGSNCTDWKTTDGLTVDLEGLQNNLMPFDTGGYYSLNGNSCTITVKYYPIFDITNGYVNTNKISKMWFECELHITGAYQTKDYSSSYTPTYHIRGVEGFVTNSGYFTPIRMDLKLNFDTYIDMGSNGITFTNNANFDPMDTNHESIILGKIKSFLEQFNYCKRHFTERMIQFDGSLICVDTTTRVVNNRTVTEFGQSYSFTKNTFNSYYGIENTHISS